MGHGTRDKVKPSIIINRQFLTRRNIEPQPHHPLQGRELKASAQIGHYIPGQFAEMQFCVVVSRKCSLIFFSNEFVWGGRQQLGGAIASRPLPCYVTDEDIANSLGDRYPCTPHI